MGVLNPTHCVWCPLWAGGPGSLKARCISHAEQASSMVSTWALDSGFLPCWSCFSDFSWWWAIMWKCKWIKPFHPQVVYYHGVSSQQWELQVRQKMQLIDKWAWLLCYKKTLQSSMHRLLSTEKDLTQPREGTQPVLKKIFTHPWGVLHGRR